MSIGERITLLCKSKNISQKDIANSLAVSRQAVSKWENDLSSPDTLNLIKLSDLLDTNVEYLATGKFTDHPPSSPAPIVIHLVQKIDRVIEKPVYKIVPKRVYIKKKIRLNPVYFIIFGGFWLLIGLLIGWLAL